MLTIPAASMSRSVPASKSAKVFADGRFQAVFSQVLRHGFAPSHAFCQDQDAAIEVFDECFQFFQRIFGTAFDLYRGHRLGDRFVTRFTGNFDAAKLFDFAEKHIHRQENFFRREQGAIAVAPEQHVARAGVLPEMLCSAFQIVVQAQQRTLRQVIEQGGGVLEKQRQVVFDTQRRQSVADILV